MTKEKLENLKNMMEIVKSIMVIGENEDVMFNGELDDESIEYIKDLVINSELIEVNE